MGFPLSLSRPSFKQAVGVVVTNGVGLPDTRNHEAEFPEGAGSPLPILEIGRVSSVGRLHLARNFRSFLLGNETGEGAERRLHSSARHFLSHGATSRWHRRQGASSSPSPQRRRACLSPFRSQEDPAPRLLTKMAEATLPLPGLVPRPATRGIQSRTQAVDPCRQAARIPSRTRWQCPCHWCVPKERRPAVDYSAVPRTFHRGVT
ncbi:hypothetical protein HPB47_005644 [Ixodes persulcatus]|uniref:Uncharacterized protein n=1 Tax=Ixodes persulcatus TaxID=34615 RepID=A0AC60PCT5_IXOPE|nr:hypothetical protein HPB47_005644 [Ixodes persulcatus]